MQRIKYIECPECLGLLSEPFLCDDVNGNCIARNDHARRHPVGLVVAHRTCANCGLFRTDIAAEAPGAVLRPVPPPRGGGRDR